MPVVHRGPKAQVAAANLSAGCLKLDITILATQAALTFTVIAWPLSGLPNTPRGLNAQVAAANLEAGCLHNVAILGNSWRSFVDTHGLFRALVGKPSRSVGARLGLQSAVPTQTVC